MKRLLRFVIIVLLVLLLGQALNMLGFGAWQPNENQHGAYPVERVVDGDTIVVLIDGEAVKVRLIGVDTPESVAPANYSVPNTPQGEEASEYVKQLLTGKSVYLEYDVQQEDRYGRTLAYVYLDDGKGTFLQELLLQEGLAQTMTIQPNSKYADRFAELQHKAAEEGIGFWADFF